MPQLTFLRIIESFNLCAVCVCACVYFYIIALYHYIVCHIRGASVHEREGEKRDVQD